MSEITRPLLQFISGNTWNQNQTFILDSHQTIRSTFILGLYAACHTHRNEKKNWATAKIPKNAFTTHRNEFFTEPVKKCNTNWVFLTRKHKASLPGRAAATFLLCRTCEELFPDWSTVRRTSQWESFIRHPGVCNYGTAKEHRKVIEIERFPCDQCSKRAYRLWGWLRVFKTITIPTCALRNR